MSRLRGTMILGTGLPVTHTRSRVVRVAVGTRALRKDTVGSSFLYGYAGRGGALQLLRRPGASSLCRNSRVRTLAAADVGSRLPEPVRRAGAAAKAAAHRRMAAARAAALLWWQSQRQWLKTWYVKVLAAGALLLGLATAAVNIWGVRAIDANMLPTATVAVSQALDREVSVGRVRWISPTGVTGLTPLASVGPVTMGPSGSGLERTSVVAPEVVISVDALQSLLQRKVVLALQAMDTQVNLVQCDNLSWFGYPEDPVPSVRATLLPGITQAQDRSDRATEQPTPAVVPPANIAGDELNIEALAAARRAAREQQRQAKHAGASHPAVQPAQQHRQQQQAQARLVQPSAQQFSLALPHGGATVGRGKAQQQQEAMAAAEPSAQHARSDTTAADANPSRESENQQQRHEQLQAELQEGATEEAAAVEAGAGDVQGAAADEAPARPPTQLQRQLQQLRLQSGGMPAHAQPQRLLQSELGLITRSGDTVVQDTSQTPAARPLAAEQTAASADAEADAQPQAAAAAISAATPEDSHPDSTAAPQTAANADEAAVAADAQGQSQADDGAEASRSAWQRIMDSMAAAPTTVRGGADASWRTLQSLPQALPQALPRALPQALPRPPWHAQWRAPWDAAPPKPAEPRPPAPRQRLLQQLRGMELRPTARHVLPDMFGPEPDAQLAEPRADDGSSQSMRQPASISRLRASAAGLHHLEAVASQAARDEVAAAVAALGNSSGAADLAQVQQQRGRQQQRDRRIEAWRDSERMRSARFGRERHGRRASRPSRLRELQHPRLAEARLREADGAAQAQPDALRHQQPGAVPLQQPASKAPQPAAAAAAAETEAAEAAATEAATAEAADELAGEGAAPSSALQEAAAAEVPTESDASHLPAAQEASTAVQQAPAPQPTADTPAEPLRRLPDSLAKVLQGASFEASPLGGSKASAGSSQQAQQGVNPDSAAQPEAAASRRRRRLGRRYAHAVKQWRKVTGQQQQPPQDLQPSSTFRTAPLAGISNSHSPLPEADTQQFSQHAADSAEHRVSPSPEDSQRHPRADVVEERQAPLLEGSLAGAAGTRAEAAPGTEQAGDAPAGWGVPQQAARAAEGSMPSSTPNADAAEAAATAARQQQALQRAEELRVTDTLQPPPPLHESISRTSSGRVKRSQDALASRYGDMLGSVGERYTPATPDEIAALDARLRKRGRRGQKGWLSRQVSRIAQNITPPEVALETLRIRDAKVDVWVAGESAPRRFEQADATVRLGRGYKRLNVDLTAAVHERDPATYKCTMLSEGAQRHLRNAPGGQLEAAGLLRDAETGGDAAAPLPQPSLPPADAVRLPASLEEARHQAEDYVSRIAQGLQAEHFPLQHEPGGAAPQLHPLQGQPPAAVAAAASDGGQGQEQRDGGAPPTGGRIAARIRVKHLMTPGKTPDLSVVITGQDLHAPLVERLIELPMDISGGRINGDLRLRAYDSKTWHFPSFGGRLRCRGGSFHFWDAVDDFSDANMDLLFEGDRMYLHNASGRFGAVPLTMTGDMDLDPETGQYRFSAEVPLVEANALRATLGVRPLPQPLAGALRGTLHVTGPLEEPLFSGTAVAVRPTPEMMAAADDTAAQAVLAAEPEAVAAYDHVPVRAGAAVFTMDTASEVFMLHSGKAEPLEGGQLVAAGRMWISPDAENDARAVRMQLQGRGLPAEALLQRYLPEGSELPPALVLGQASCSGTMSGSHVEPTISGTWEAPAAQASGSLDLRPTATKVSCQAPALSASATLHTRPSSLEAMKQALTQAHATELGKVVVEACDVEADLRGLDVLPLVSPPAAAPDGRPAAPAAPHQRLRLTGHTSFSGRAVPNSEDAEGAADGGASTTFSGDLKLEQLRVNQLRLCRQLSGSLEVGPGGVRLHARGLRPDEALDVDIAGAVLRQTPSPEPATAAPARPGPAAFAAGNYNVAPAAAQRPGGSQLLAAGRPAPVLTKTHMDGADGGGHFSLRCGPLLVSAEVNHSTSQVDCQVTGLALDELELASLRGTVQEAALHVNFDTRMGRGNLKVAGPRFSGLQGEALAGSFRWERDVVRLEKVKLEQRHSTYEVSGDYTIPAGAPLPRTAASLALPPVAAPVVGSTSGIGARGAAAAAVPQQDAAFDLASGRWRIQVNVKEAHMEEILPAARLLSRATAVTPLDYERAKSAFLQHMQRAGVAAAELGAQVEEVMAAAKAQAAADAADAAASEGSASTPSKKGAGRAAALPGLQDVRGQWKGSWEAYGGGGGATSVEFGVRGEDWEWGDYGLDKVVAEGAYHSEEGIKLHEFLLSAGEAKLAVKGDLLGARQDAVMKLDDFPMAMLQPIFRAMPALQHAAPAVGAPGTSPPAAELLNRISIPFLKSVGQKGSAGVRKAVGYNMSSFANSPVNGLLYMTGSLGGSAAEPEGKVFLQLCDGAIGTTRLATANARAAIDATQKLDFAVELEPSAARNAGHLKVAGVVPLSELSGSRAEKEELNVEVDVKDSGMMIVTTVAPELQWIGGAAHLQFTASGHLDAPKLGGKLAVSKGSFACPSLLRYPVTGLTATVFFEDDGGRLRVEALDARVGRRGHIRMRGQLPLQPPPRRQLQQPANAEPAAISVDVHNLELRARNLYTGYLDAEVNVERSLLQPVVGGSVRVSRGAAFLFPQAAPASPAAAAGGAAVAPGTGSAQASAFAEGERQGGLISQAFTALSAKRGSALGRSLSRLEPQAPGAGEARADNLVLHGLAVQLGPDLRVLYPMNVLNFGIAGELVANGPADPAHLKLAGTIRLQGGEINLVATQLQLDREHPNRLVFSPEAGLDPAVDVVLAGSRLRAHINGRASAWQDHIVLTSGPRSNTTAAGGEGAEQLDAAEAARIFEGQLAGALLAEDGQLALSSLASNTLSTLMPKLETQGRVGQARWRLVSAPSIPGLLSLDPNSDPTNVLSSLTMGTEVEVQFGRSLQAAMSRKLRDSDIATQWTLNYALSQRLRMQFNIASSSPYPRTLLFQYSGEGVPFAGNK